MMGAGAILAFLWANKGKLAVAALIAGLIAWIFILRLENWNDRNAREKAENAETAAKIERDKWVTTAGQLSAANQALADQARVLASVRDSLNELAVKQAELSAQLEAKAADIKSSNRKANEGKANAPIGPYTSYAIDSLYK